MQTDRSSTPGCSSFPGARGHRAGICAGISLALLACAVAPGCSTSIIGGGSGGAPPGAIVPRTTSSSVSSSSGTGGNTGAVSSSGGIGGAQASSTGGIGGAPPGSSTSSSSSSGTGGAASSTSASSSSGSSSGACSPTNPQGTCVAPCPEDELVECINGMCEWLQPSCQSPPECFTTPGYWLDSTCSCSYSPWAEPNAPCSGGFCDAASSCEPCGEWLCGPTPPCRLAPTCTQVGFGGSVQCQFANAPTGTLCAGGTCNGNGTCVP